MPLSLAAAWVRCRPGASRKATQPVTSYQFLLLFSVLLSVSVILVADLSEI